MTSNRPDVPHKDAISGSATIVIGGTSGIGFAVASAAVAASGSVFVSSSSEDKVNNSISRLATLYPSASSLVSGLAADLSQAKTIEVELIRVFAAAVKFFGRPFDHVVVTAGGPPPTIPLANFDPATAYDHSTLRILLPMVIAKLIAKFPGTYVNPTSSSSITLTSGVLIKKPFPGFSSTLFTGGSMDTIRRCLSIDLAPIRTNVVTPGAVQTELLDTFPDAAQDYMRQNTLTKELGSSADLAEAYLHCMRSRFMIGEEMIVDGGSLLK